MKTTLIIRFSTLALLAVVTLSFTTAVASAAQQDKKATAKKPNIIFVMADDLGWMDLHCQGNKGLDTPNIDRFASQGVRFTNAYAACPVCSPTRAAMMTGMAPARLAITNHIPDVFFPKDDRPQPAFMYNYLDDKYTTIAERLRGAGYGTAFLGKWHLAGGGRRHHGLGDLTYYPERQGFDINVGGCALGGPPTYFDPYKIHNIPPRKNGEYLTDRLVDDTISYIRANKDKPFYVNLWLYTVHWPMESKPEKLSKYEKRLGPGVKDARYAGMIECMDDAFGRLMKALDEMGLSENTLVVFTSDNGGYGGIADNRPLRRDKGHLYEGGVRVPAIIRWPGKTKAGVVCDTPTVTMDYFPTFLQAAGLTPEKDVPLDGEDITPLLDGQGSLKRDSICIHYPNYAFHMDNRLGSSIRSGDYKLIEFFDDNSVELYNLKKDIGETKDLAAEMPEKATELRKKLHQWRKDVGAKMPKPPLPKDQQVAPKKK